MQTQKSRIVNLAIAFFVMLLPWSHLAEAQQPGKVPRIGYVSGSGGPSNPGPQIEAFRQGLRDLGYIEKKNILVEYRYVEGELDRVPRLVAELVRLNLDVLVVGPASAIRAAKQATKTIPIVMVAIQDPVATGIVDSLARPGGNITGLTSLTRDLSGKRLELLKEAIPGISRVGILWNPAGSGIGFKGYEAAARELKIELQSLGVRSLSPDLEVAFQLAVKGRAKALIATSNPVFTDLKQIADLAIKNRLPLMCEANRYVEAGGLMSYAANDAEGYRRAAYYVDKILKGTKPADLPVEQPMKLELIINLKTAKQIGVTIPPNVLARADRVIR
jgi:putative ABC transport system substrate-binding protein